MGLHPRSQGAPPAPSHCMRQPLPLSLPCSRRKLAHWHCIPSSPCAQFCRHPRECPWPCSLHTEKQLQAAQGTVPASHNASLCPPATGAAPKEPAPPSPKPGGRPAHFICHISRPATGRPPLRSWGAKVHVSSCRSQTGTAVALARRLPSQLHQDLATEASQAAPRQHYQSPNANPPPPSQALVQQGSRGEAGAA